jgi:hypothetical protein
MNLPAGINKWGAAVLGVVCFFLVAHLVVQFRSLQPGKSHAHLAAAGAQAKRVEKGSAHGADDLAQYDPDVHFDALKKLDSRPLPDEDRVPFDSGVVAAAPQRAAAAAPTPQGAAPAPVAPPPPPPAPPLAAAGYNEYPGGQKEAMLTFTDPARKDEIVTVHEGDMIGTRFKVTKIDSTMVVVEDGETHKTLELPFPQ